MQQAAKSLGWKIEMLDSNLSANTQVSNIQTLIQEKVSAIASWTLDSGATAGIYSQSEEAGIPIVGMNSVGTGVAATVWYEASTHAGTAGTYHAYPIEVSGLPAGLRL